MKNIINRQYDVIKEIKTVFLIPNNVNTRRFEITIKYRKKTMKGISLDEKTVTKYLSGNELERTRAKYKLMNIIINEYKAKQLKLEL